MRELTKTLLEMTFLAGQPGQSSKLCLSVYHSPVALYHAIEETMEAHHDLVKAGKTRYIGASSMEARQFQRANQVAEKKWMDSLRFHAKSPEPDLSAYLFEGKRV